MPSPVGQRPAARRTVDVLLVDDNADVRESFVEFVALNGYTAEVAASAEQALSLLREGLQPGLILLDYLMPGIGGEGFLAEQGRSPEIARIPVIFISGADPSTIPPGKTLLQKPVRMERLLPLLQALRRS